MPLECQSATAFRTTWTERRSEASDVVRVIKDGGFTLALLAAGSEGAFSTYWAPASRLFLNMFTDAWHGTSGPARERLLGAFAIARERFAERVPRLTEADPIFDDVFPSAVLIATVIEGTTAHMAWIGGHVGLVARGGSVLVKTTPHTLFEQYRRDHPDNADSMEFKEVIVRTMSADPTAGGPPDYLAAEVDAGDTLIMLSRIPFHGPCVPIKDAAAMAAGASSASALAEHLTHMGLPDETSGYAAVAVLRIDASL